MTIKDVCEEYKITPDTLRYYERVGAISVSFNGEASAILLLLHQRNKCGYRASFA